MRSHVALLRAVNVGGTGRLRMEDLRSALRSLRLEEVATVLQSGNAAFASPRASLTRMEQELEAALQRRLRFQTDAFVRTRERWDALVADNPFPHEARTDPARLVVTALKTSVPGDRWRLLDAAIRGPERVAGAGDMGYLVYPDGQGRSQLTPALIERCLGTRTTSRNWNSVLRLRALLSA